MHAEGGQCPAETARGGAGLPPQACIGRVKRVLRVRLYVFTAMAPQRVGGTRTASVHTEYAAHWLSAGPECHRAAAEGLMGSPEGIAQRLVPRKTGRTRAIQIRNTCARRRRAISFPHR